MYFASCLLLVVLPAITSCTASALHSFCFSGRLSWPGKVPKTSINSRFIRAPCYWHQTVLNQSAISSSLVTANGNALWKWFILWNCFTIEDDIWQRLPQVWHVTEHYYGMTSKHLAFKGINKNAILHYHSSKETFVRASNSHALFAGISGFYPAMQFHVFSQACITTELHAWYGMAQ